jgi:hypothetical protein
MPQWQAISEWLSQNLDVSDYVILDDQATEFPHGLEHLVVCDPMLGISGEDAFERLRTWIAE